ncbi:MAG: type II toxin-antitoxin system VapC family toxin [Actinomycetes bacterium]|jgi:predicted nucleic acid-binding protein
MITYFDTSLFVKLLIDEIGSEQAEEIWNVSSTLGSSMVLYVESRAALAAAKRRGRINDANLVKAKLILEGLHSQLYVVEVTSKLVKMAAELAEEFSLRGYDSIHLASAIFMRADVFASSDEALSAAAQANGFHIVV